MHEDSPGSRIDRFEILPGRNRPVGPPQHWLDLPDFRDTPGPSFTIAPGGGIVYLRGAPAKAVSYLRVVPHWVGLMKRAVDAADRGKPK